MGKHSFYMRNVVENKGLDEILYDNGVLPTRGGLFGKKACAKAAGFKDADYFNKLIQSDPSCYFIFAMVGSNSHERIVTLVHSVEPGCDFLIVSNESSLTNWRQEHNIEVKMGQLERAGKAGEKTLKKYTDVCGGTKL